MFQKLSRFAAIAREQGIKGAGRAIWDHASVRGLRDSAILRIARLRGRNGFVVQPVQGSKLRIDLSDPGIGRELLLTGVHEQRTTDIVRDEVTEGMVVLDVGANIGYYALLESLLVGDTGRVHAVEPVPGNYALLCENVALNERNNISTHCFAVSDRPGQAEFSVADASNWGSMMDAGSDDVSDYMKEKIASIERERIVVDSKTIDQFVRDEAIGGVNLIRMDIEGYEIQALRGAHDTLANMPSPLKLLLEVHNKHFEAPSATLGPTFEHLIGLGFRPKTLIAKRNTHTDIDPSEFIDLLCSYRTICCHVLMER